MKCESKCSRKPTDVFKKCPRCAEFGDADLFEFDGDVFCDCCGWNSIGVQVEYTSLGYRNFYVNRGLE